MKASDVFSLMCAAFAAVTVVVESNRLDDAKAESTWLQNELSEATRRGNETWARCSVPLDGGVTTSYYWRPASEACPDAVVFLAWPAPKESK